MRRNHALRSHVPETELFSRAALAQLLKRYGMVYIKPLRGSHGRGVIRIDIDAKNGQEGVRGTIPAYSVHIGATVRKQLSSDALWQAIRPYTDKEPYLIQQGIRLLQYDGRPFDLRVVTQLDRNRDWRLTGMLARVAHSGKAVTNGSQGATIHTFDTALAPYGSAPARRRLKADLQTLGLRTAQALKRSFPFLQEIGFDIALDSRLHPWILEANSRPEAIPFRKLADPTMYRRILQFRRIADLQEARLTR